MQFADWCFQPLNPFSALAQEEPGGSSSSASTSRSASASSLRASSTRRGPRGRSPLAPASPPRPTPPAAEHAPPRSPAKLLPTGRITEGHISAVQSDRERIRKLLIIARGAKADAAYWRREAKLAKKKPAGSRAEYKHKGRTRKSRTTNVKANNEYILKQANHIISEFEKYDAETKAGVVDRLLETFDAETRALLRALPVVAREGFVAVRGAISKLQNMWWTPMNWLELRLKKYLVMRVFTHGHKLFSKRLCSDGIWRSATFMKIPGPLHKARKDGIYADLKVPSPFRSPKAIKEAQDDVLRHHHFAVAEVQ